MNAKCNDSEHLDLGFSHAEREEIKLQMELGREVINAATIGWDEMSIFHHE